MRLSHVSGSLQMELEDMQQVQLQAYSHACNMAFSWHHLMKHAHASCWRKLMKRLFSISAHTILALMSIGMEPSTPQASSILKHFTSKKVSLYLPIGSGGSMGFCLKNASGCFKT